MPGADQEVARSACNYGGHSLKTVHAPGFTPGGGRAGDISVTSNLCIAMEA